MATADIDENAYLNEDEGDDDNCSDNDSIDTLELLKGLFYFILLTTLSSY